MTEIDKNDAEFVERVEAMLALEAGGPHEEPLDDLAHRRLIDDLVARSHDHAPREAPTPAPGSRIHWPAVIVAGAVGGLAASLAFVLLTGSPSANRGGAERPRAAQAPSASVPAPAALELLAGELIAPDGRAPLAAAGRSTAGDRGALVRVGERGLLLAIAGSVVTLDPSRPFDVRLHSGGLLVDVDPAGAAPAPTIRTPHGEVRVTGTVFTVAVRDGATEVGVARGRVELVGEGDRIEVPGGFAAGIGGGAPAPVDAGSVSAVLEVAARLRVATGDGEELLTELDTSELLLASRADPMDADGADEAEARRRGPAPDELIERAASAKREGDWTAAAASYRELLRLHPHGAEASVALVALGRLQLEHLGDPAAALGAFDRYLKLRPAGPLAVEAEWNRARALSRLGRHAEEKTALERFLARHPAALQGPTARARLEQLR